ncbi:YrzO family protein [Bacillus inaquosorum]|nr:MULTISPECIES: YrzO family protein [Bacillus]RKQ25991.1 YrzO family protein [Bacillus subtilis]MCE0739269.1 YrzO family protein [Bacillus sp. G16]MCY7750112.1 YrzO family protein [Bacillus inaquosorum]MCY7768213.1 YrzO family protein [Bacillus inaquosorum]MCY7910683.1 YrzO family protein [Bacillus inaquosorum]
MLEGLLFFISAGIVCELAAINRNGRKNIKQQEELIQVLKEFLNKDIKSK